MNDDMREDELGPLLPASLTAALDDPSVWEEPPPDLEARVLTALREAREAPAEAPSTPAEAPAAEGEPQDELTRARRRREARRFSPAVLMAAAAAVLVILLGVGAVVVATQGSNSPGQVVALSGTDLAPGATGKADITSTPSGFEVKVDISGLKPAPPGFYYQGWLKSDTDAVTIGTFHARQGSDGIVLWSGVDPGPFKLLTVTLQEVGGGPESSGKVVLSGPLR